MELTIKGQVIAKKYHFSTKGIVVNSGGRHVAIITDINVDIGAFIIAKCYIQEINIDGHSNKIEFFTEDIYIRK